MQLIVPFTLRLKKTPLHAGISTTTPLKLIYTNSSYYPFYQPTVPRSVIQKPNAIVGHLEVRLVGVQAILQNVPDRNEKDPPPLPITKEGKKGRTLFSPYFSRKVSKIKMPATKISTKNISGEKITSNKIPENKIFRQRNLNRIILG